MAKSLRSGIRSRIEDRMMTSRTTIAIAAICLVALSACSNGKFTFGNALGDFSRVTGVKTGLEEEGESTVAPAALTAAAEGPPLIVGFKAIRVAIPLAGQSGPSKTYASPDGVVIAMNDGFVTRATGLGIDLRGSYLAANSSWFDGLKDAAEKGHTTDRVIEYWESGRTKRDKFRCSLESSPRESEGAIIDEICKRYFEDFAFTNRYWLAADGSIECSRQWIHPKLDPLQFFRTEQQATSFDLVKNGC